MKIEKILKVKTKYSFEAPMVLAHFGKDDSKDKKSSLLSIDLNNYLAPAPRDTFLVQVNGESMIDESIFNGDVLVVNSKEEPRDGKIVIAALNGELAVKQLRIIDGKPYLVSANKIFLPIAIEPYMEFQIQGIVKHVIHSL